MIRDLAGGGDASAPLLKRFCRADTHVALDVRYIHIQSREWNYLGGGGVLRASILFRVAVFTLQQHCCYTAMGCDRLL